MPLRLDIKKKLSSRSDRVKSVDFHPTEPWLLASLYNGNVYIWNHENQTLVKTFEVTELPVRSAKFIARKSWLICGSDDMHIRVFNYNTHEKVTAFEAHADYIRSIAVHPSQPYVLSSSDDMLIKLWDWEKGWRNIMVFEGHSHYVMQVVFNPKDPNTFASASLDRSIKIWSLGSPVPNYTLEGHEKGVNCLDYYHGGERPYLVSGADDKLVKVWDYQNKTCVQTLEGHTQNVSVVCFHPELPIIITGSEDGTARIWHANTYRLENTLNYGMERVWAIGYLRGSNDIALGYDEGTVCIKLGREDPAVSMDNSGKIIWAKHSEIQQAMVKGTTDESAKDGERLTLPTKDLGSCEIYPQTLQHSPNGRFVVVCGDGEYIIYTALAWRNKSFGNALEFVWASDSNDYAVRESTSRVKLFKNFKENTNVVIRTPYAAEGIFGGALLGVRSSSSLNFYDWETGAIARRVDVVAKQVFWSESNLVAICSEESFYVLKFNRVAFQTYLERVGGPNGITDEGVEEAFEFVAEISETVKTGCWVGDCFIYTNTANRLNYLVGNQVTTIAHFDTPMYLLGYIARDNKVYLTDKDLGVVSYLLPLAVVEYQTAILRQEFAAAERVLPTIPVDHRNKIARFLETQGLKEMALQVSTDQDQRFDLAIALNNLAVAFEIATVADRSEKWAVVGDAALNAWNFPLAEECMKRAKDLEGLLLLYQASGNGRGLYELSKMAMEVGKHNIAFSAHLLLGNVDSCLDLLKSTDRLPEAALFARTYMPSQMTPIAKEWRDSLLQQGKSRIAKTIANPEENANLFPDLSYGLLAEDAFRRQKAKGPIPAAEYSEYKDAGEWDLIGELKKRFPDGVPQEIIASIQHQPISQSPLPVQQKQSTLPPQQPQSPPRSSPQLQQEPPTQPLPPSSPNARSVASSSSSPKPRMASPSMETSLPPKPTNSTTATNVNVPRFVTEAADAGAVDDFVDSVSDNFSHLSMDVNTTGTGSIKGDMDFEEDVQEEEDEDVATPEVNLEEISKPPVTNPSPSPKPPAPSLLDDDDDLDKLLNS